MYYNIDFFKGLFSQYFFKVNIFHKRMFKKWQRILGHPYLNTFDFLGGLFQGVFFKANIFHQVIFRKE